MKITTATLLMWLVPAFGCSEDPAIPPSPPDPIVPATPPCFTALREPDFTSAAPGDEPITRSLTSHPDVQLHIGGMSGTQHLGVSAAYTQDLPLNRFFCLATALELEVRTESATACGSETVELAAEYDDRAGCSLPDATITIDDAIVEMRVIARAVSPGTYNIPSGRPVSLTVEKLDQPE